MSRGAPHPWLKPGLFVGALAPLIVMVVEAVQGTLGANPIAEVTYPSARPDDPPLKEKYEIKGRC